MFIKNKGRLHLFNLADKLQHLQDNFNKNHGKKQSILRDVSSGSNKKRSLSRETFGIAPKIHKSQSNHQNHKMKAEGIKEFHKKPAEEQKVANNINRYMMDALQKDMGLLENHLVKKKVNKKTMVFKWPSDLMISTLKH